MSSRSLGLAALAQPFLSPGPLAHRPQAPSDPLQGRPTHCTHRPPIPGPRIPGLAWPPAPSASRVPGASPAFLLAADTGFHLPLPGSGRLAVRFRSEPSCSGLRRPPGLQLVLLGPPQLRGGSMPSVVRPGGHTVVALGLWGPRPPGVPVPGAVCAGRVCARAVGQPGQFAKAVPPVPAAQSPRRLGTRRGWKRTDATRPPSVFRSDGRRPPESARR